MRYLPWVDANINSLLAFVWVEGVGEIRANIYKMKSHAIREGIVNFKAYCPSLGEVYVYPLLSEPLRPAILSILSREGFDV